VSRTCELHCGNLLVAIVHEPFESGSTWFGSVRVTLQAGDGAHAARVLQFIAFTIDWHARVERDPAHPPDPEEFDRFTDLVDSGVWFTRWPDGHEEPIGQAPAFAPGGEVSWFIQSQSPA
jgi:hypothetical protein